MIIINNNNFIILNILMFQSTTSFKFIYIEKYIKALIGTENSTRLSPFYWVYN